MFADHEPGTHEPGTHEPGTREPVAVEIHPVDLLSLRWPAIFDNYHPRPLKVGIHLDLVNAGIPLVVARKAMRAYVTRPNYKKTVLAGAVRIDLEGQPAGVVTEQQAEYALRPPGPSKPAQPKVPKDLPITEENIVAGKLEVTIRFNSLPKPLIIQDGIKFGIKSDGKLISVTMRPKFWNKLTAAAERWPSWVATLTGKIGATNTEGFELLEPAVQIFEKKGKGAGTAGVQETPRIETPIVENIVSNIVEKIVEKKPEPIVPARETKSATIIMKPRRKLAA